MRAVNLFNDPVFIEEIKLEDKTMLEHLPTLRKINKMGFLSLDSQAGRTFKSKNYKTGEKYREEQRAYLIGMMEINKAVSFVRRMSMDTDKIAVPVTANPTHSRQFNIPLTINIMNHKVEVRTSTPLTLPELSLNRYKEELQLNQNENVVCILCWDPIWNRSVSDDDGLFEDVLDCL